MDSDSTYFKFYSADKAGYDPAYKYDLIFRCMVHNCNAITLYAEQNQTVDETTWGHAGFGEAGSGLTGRLMNKKVNKGGQTTIMSDSRRFRPRAYIHRHKMHDSKGMTRKGCTELAHLIEDIHSMILDDPTAENAETDETAEVPIPESDPITDANPTGNTNPHRQPVATTEAPWLIKTPRDPSKKQIFRHKPVICADNFFLTIKCVSSLVRMGMDALAPMQGMYYQR